jgi:hypothetical protein
MLNSGHCVTAYLCAELHIADGGGARRIRLVFLIQDTPVAGWARGAGVSATALNARRLPGFAPVLAAGEICVLSAAQFRADQVPALLRAVPAYRTPG